MTHLSFEDRFFNTQMTSNVKNIFAGRYHLLEDFDNRKFVKFFSYFKSIYDFVKSDKFTGEISDIKSIKFAGEISNIDSIYDHCEVIENFYRSWFYGNENFLDQENFYDFLVCHAFKAILEERDLNIKSNLDSILKKLNEMAISHDLFRILNSFFKLTNDSRINIDDSELAGLNQVKFKLAEKFFLYAKQQNFSEIFDHKLNLIYEARMLLRSENVDNYIDDLKQRVSEIRFNKDLIFQIDDLDRDKTIDFIEKLNQKLKSIEEKFKPSNSSRLKDKITKVSAVKSSNNISIF